MNLAFSNQILAAGQRCINIEIEALNALPNYLNNDFVEAVYAIWQCSGRIVLTGIGKSAIIGQKIAATFNSTGTPALFMHAADAIHGDLGMVQANDIVLCLSKSGETPEIKTLIPIFRANGNTLIAIVGNVESFLALNASYVLNTHIEREACINNLAPTASTIAQMAMGDALAVCVLELREFSPQDFAKFHPGGMLGKQLYLRIDDVCRRNPRPSVSPDMSLQKVIVEISANRMGATAVVNPSNNALVGIITDGDLRRAFGRYPSFEGLCAANIMTPNPKVIEVDELAINALDLMRNYKVSQLIVMQNEQYRGMVHLHDLLREGFV